MPKLELEIQCKSCQGTGLYQGVGEGKGTAVVCYDCKGTGKAHYSFQYEEFTGRKLRDDVERVYRRGSPYKLGLGKINFDDIGEIDMDHEGISYREFLNGDTPKHIKQLGCPMMVDQGACHEIKGFVETCNELNGGWINYIPNCKNKKNILQCWKRFEEESTEKL